jgi:hypothetical protein
MLASSILASVPANMLNQKSAALGIPFDSLRPDIALVILPASVHPARALSQPFLLTGKFLLKRVLFRGRACMALAGRVIPHLSRLRLRTSTAARLVTRARIGKRTAIERPAPTWPLS